ncbi:hypothetical protein [Paenibacillus silviterrae]|uniref:hypothetical protein n=1 Tax=Paenibacillus silviterrae TaxID=3242194 RepID=UPI002542E584|nr:hypothetical protein [Paenibacillus chinjuensis]
MLSREILPLDYATITKEGISFNGSLFTTALAIKQQWFLNNEKELQSIPVCFNPDDPSTLILLIEGIGLVRAVKVPDQTPTEEASVQLYFSDFVELKARWRRRKNRKRSK